MKRHSKIILHLSILLLIEFCACQTTAETRSRGRGSSPQYPSSYSPFQGNANDESQALPEQVQKVENDTYSEGINGYENSERDIASTSIVITSTHERTTEAIHLDQEPTPAPLTERPLPDNPINTEFPSGGKEELPPQDPDSVDEIIPVKIIVVGRSGTGVSSTVRELIGSATQCEKPEGKETFQNIPEYTISDILSADGKKYEIQIVDIPGFVDGHTMEWDAQILATLKSYISLEGPPDFLLAISRFDDNRFNGAHSLFVQFLKRLELIEDKFLRKLNQIETNVVFLLTHLMSDKSIQRKPASRIQDFRDVIKEHSVFSPSPSGIVVGDNHVQSDNRARVENGYYRLPNKQYYPKNIWEALINSTIEASESHLPVRRPTIQAALNAIKDNREIEMKCTARLVQTDWDEYNSDADAFLSLLIAENTTVQDNQVNSEIDKVFSTKELYYQREQMIQKTALQIHLQNNNITSITDLPDNFADRAAFFQKSSLVASTIPALLLNDAFKLSMPEYIQALTVGFGYDVLVDDVTLLTPFKTDSDLPSAVGYQFPSFMKCRKLLVPESQEFKEFSETLTDYFAERLKSIEFSKEENINVSKVEFNGKAKSGYNFRPVEGESIVSLSAAKDIKTLRCKIAESSSWRLDHVFVQNILDLQPVNIRNRDSVTDWRIFLQNYGTHVIVKGYGGGTLLGSLVGPNVGNAFESPSTLDSTLDSIIKFSSFSVPNLGKPTYNMYGGSMIPQMEQFYDLPESERDKLLKDWSESLQSNFIMLKQEFGLQRISTIVNEKMDSSKGEMVDAAIDLYLRGELEFQRKKRKPGNSTSGGVGRRRPTPTPTSSPIGNAAGLRENERSGPVSPPTRSPIGDSRLGENEPSQHVESPTRSPIGNAGLGEEEHRQSASVNTKGHPHTPSISNSELSIGSTHASTGLLPFQQTRLPGSPSSSFGLNILTSGSSGYNVPTYSSSVVTTLQPERGPGASTVYEGSNYNIPDKSFSLASTTESARRTDDTISRRPYSYSDSWREQLKRDREAMENQIKSMRRSNDEAERRHRILMAELERQDREEKEREMKKKCECFGKKKHYPMCWGKVIIGFFSSSESEFCKQVLKPDRSTGKNPADKENNYGYGDYHYQDRNEYSYGSQVREFQGRSTPTADSTYGAQPSYSNTNENYGGSYSNSQNYNHRQQQPEARYQTGSIPDSGDLQQRQQSSNSYTRTSSHMPGHNINYNYNSRTQSNNGATYVSQSKVYTQSYTAHARGNEQTTTVYQSPPVTYHGY